MPGSVVVEEPAVDVVDDGELVPDGAVDTDEPEERVDVPAVSVDEELDELDEADGEEVDDELESVGSARATPGIVAIAVPTPRATASAPTRPI
jgi:hypothetical protein